MKGRVLISVILASLFMIACSDDDVTVMKTETSLQFEIPSNLPKGANVNLSDLVVFIENVNTGESNEYIYSSSTSLVLEDGMYNIKASKGKISYTISYIKKVPIIDPDTGFPNGDHEEKKIQETITNNLKGAKENIEVTGGKINIKIPLFMYKENTGSGFVISEIFASKTYTPEGKPYIAGDVFVEIYNNSDKVLYADGLCVGETPFMFQTTMKLFELSPDFREEKVAVENVYRVPGSGTDYPVKPGETLLLCDVAINHKAVNPNSVDLSKANFEWFDGAKADDVDVPEIPNLEIMIKHEEGAWNINGRGQTAIVIFRLDKGITTEQFFTKTAFTYNHKYFGMDAEEKAWGVENSKIIDAVQLTVPDWFQWTIISKSLDFSWTYFTEENDYNGLSVKRKISHKDGDRIVLQDTNDSASDFIPLAPNPSPGVVSDHK